MGADLVLRHPRIDAVLDRHRQALGPDGPGYRHHVYRVLNFFLALEAGACALREDVAIAAACHDLGIWTARTFDYLEPSAALAERHLAEDGPPDADRALVRALIVEHHKLTPYRGGEPWAPLVERWRRADVVDVSLGLVRHGLPREFVRAVRAALPDEGFHRRLAALTAREFLRRPWRPLPMMRW